MKIKLTSAVVIGGKIQKSGSVIDVPVALAREIVQRGKADNIAAAKAPAKSEAGDGDKGDGDKK